jgi:hypothetical protein
MTISAKTTAIVASCIVLGIIIFDIVLASDGVKGNTISEVMRYWSSKVLLLPWAWGVLAGHFFHPSWSWQPHQPIGVAILVWFSVAAWAVAYTVGMPMLVLTGAGVVAGVFLWPC